jgi:hypothetical protein
MQKVPLCSKSYYKILTMQVNRKELEEKEEEEEEEEEKTECNIILQVPPRLWCVLISEGILMKN